MPPAPAYPGDAEVRVSHRSTPRRRSGVLELDMGDGLIVYDDDTSFVHHLNPSATLIWRLCDGDVVVEDLANDIAEEYGLDPRTVGEQVASAISQLASLGLIEDGPGEPEPGTPKA